MTRQELDDRLLDYLYDELEPSERNAFERALATHPDVAKEVEGHRATRRAYQALPREVAPAGLLADVLAAADAEAAKRSQAASAAPIGFWERARRMMFQPAFAMAMVVMVVAGVSLINSRNSELPGMPPSSDAQHIPPVTVNEAKDQSARSEVPAAAADSPRTESGIQLNDELAAALQDARAASPSAPEPTVAAAPRADPTSMNAREANVWGAPEAKLDASELAKPPVVVTKSPAKNEREQMGYGEDLKKAVGSGAADRTVDGDLMNGLAKESEDELARDDADPARRNTNSVDPAPRAPLEPLGGTVTQPAIADREAGPTPDVTRPDEKAKAPSKPTDTADKKEEPAPVVTPERRVDAPKVATKDIESDRGGMPPPQEESLEVKRSDVARTVPAGDSTRVASPDDSGSVDKKPATLTPPAPTSDKLWSTYQQQAAAGAYADALRSIDALAKVEGESSRVKQARAELKKRLEPVPVPAGANKLPPDPPVQPPK